MTASLSRSVEDYLKVIYQLTERGDHAATTAIAERLAVAPASVTGMIKRLAESGHVAHEPYRGVRLTSDGRTAALAVMRRHRLLETYLITKLGYDWSSVHEEAERLEHAVSDELIERMAFALGHPQYDPHGAPIPTRDGEIERTKYVALAEVEVGDRVALRQVGDEDAERLRYLESIGLVPMTALEVIDRQPFGGPKPRRRAGHPPRGVRSQGALACHLVSDRDGGSVDRDGDGPVAAGRNDRRRELADRPGATDLPVRAGGHRSERFGDARHPGGGGPAHHSVAHRSRKR